jgi:hypothetical protein
MNDYRMTFPVTALVSGVAGVFALREELERDAPGSARNALGDPRDASGDIVIRDTNLDPSVPPPDVWYGRPGSAATSYTDPNGDVVQVPARGDPALYYVHIRSGQTARGFRPDQYGMQDSDAVDSAAVLGIWLGDEVPTAARGARDGSRRK